MRCAVAFALRIPNLHIDEIETLISPSDRRVLSALQHHRGMAVNFLRACSLEAPTQMAGEKALNDHVEGDVVGGPVEPVTFVRVQRIRHRDAAGFQRSGHLIGFASFDARIVGSLPDQQRPGDPMGAMQR